MHEAEDGGGVLTAKQTKDILDNVAYHDCGDGYITEYIFLKLIKLYSKKSEFYSM